MKLIYTNQPLTFKEDPLPNEIAVIFQNNRTTHERFEMRSYGKGQYGFWPQVPCQYFSLLHRQSSLDTDTSHIPLLRVEFEKVKEVVKENNIKFIYWKDFDDFVLMDEISLLLRKMLVDVFKELDVYFLLHIKDSSIIFTRTKEYDSKGNKIKQNEQVLLHSDLYDADLNVNRLEQLRNYYDKVKMENFMASSELENIVIKPEPR